MGYGRPARGEDATRRAALDELRSGRDLVADGAPDLVDAIGDALLHAQRHHVRRQAALGARVEVTAGRADGVPGGHDPGPGEPARLRGLADRHVEQVATRPHEQGQVANGRWSEKPWIRKGGGRTCTN